MTSEKISPANDAVSSKYRSQTFNTTEIHCIPRITFSFNPQGSSCAVNHTQFPLRAAYATTFNGSQDLTLQRAVIDLRSDLFHCQLYSTLSRVRNRNDIRVLFASINEDRDTANIAHTKDSSCSANETSCNILPLLSSFSASCISTNSILHIYKSSIASKGELNLSLHVKPNCVWLFPDRLVELCYLQDTPTRQRLGLHQPTLSHVHAILPPQQVQIRLHLKGSGLSLSK